MINMVALMIELAAQMWLLGRVLPFMIGSNVPEENQHWKNFLKLLEIVDYLMAPDITEDEVGYLSILIQQHHQEFIRLYTINSAIPKHHFMIHMARLILKYVCIVMHSYTVEPDTCIGISCPL